jgi:hypothetical protein
MVGAAGSSQTAKVTTTKLYFNASTGRVSATEFNSLSDMTMKTDFLQISNPTDNIAKLNGLNFAWKENGIRSLGVLAQEVEKIFPEIVHTNPKGEKTVAYNGLIAVLIESIKELNQKIKQLEDKNK